MTSTATRTALLAASNGAWQNLIGLTDFALTLTRAVCVPHCVASESQSMCRVCVCVCVCVDATPKFDCCNTNAIFLQPKRP